MSLRRASDQPNAPQSEAPMPSLAGMSVGDVLSQPLLGAGAGGARTFAGPAVGSVAPLCPKHLKKSSAASEPHESFTSTSDGASGANSSHTFMPRVASVGMPAASKRGRVDWEELDLDKEEEPSEQDPEMAEELQGMGIDVDGPGREEQDFIVPERQRTEERIQERLRADKEKNRALYIEHLRKAKDVVDQEINARASADQRVLQEDEVKDLQQALTEVGTAIEQVQAALQARQDYENNPPAGESEQERQQTLRSLQADVTQAFQVYQSLSFKYQKTQERLGFDNISLYRPVDLAADLVDRSILGTFSGPNASAQASSSTAALRKDLAPKLTQAGKVRKTGESTQSQARTKEAHETRMAYIHAFRMGQDNPGINQKAAEAWMKIRGNQFRLRVQIHAIRHATWAVFMEKMFELGYWDFDKTKSSPSDKLAKTLATRSETADIPNSTIVTPEHKQKKKITWKDQSVNMLAPWNLGMTFTPKEGKTVGSEVQAIYDTYIKPLIPGEDEPGGDIRTTQSLVEEWNKILENAKAGKNLWPKSGHSVSQNPTWGGAANFPGSPLLPWDVASEVQEYRDPELNYGPTTDTDGPRELNNTVPNSKRHVLKCYKISSF